MYQIEGREFTELIPRAFGGDLSIVESRASHPGHFSSCTRNLRTDSFDILHFSCRFEQDIRVNALQDTNHVSLHFHLGGYSDASISGLDQPLDMKSGFHNLLNCVDPVSNFIFPEQERYEYMCVGLKPSFFQTILEESGEIGDRLLKNSAHKKPFGLFKQSKASDLHQIQALKALKDPPIADSLKEPFLRSKVRELTLLTLGRSVEAVFIKGLTGEDVAKLQAVREYLLRDFLLPQSLESISRQFLLNEFKLKSGFRKLFSTTVFGFIHELRMNHALLLIQSGGLTVGDIR